MKKSILKMIVVALLLVFQVSCSTEAQPDIAIQSLPSPSPTDDAEMTTKSTPEEIITLTSAPTDSPTPTSETFPVKQIAPETAAATPAAGVRLVKLKDWIVSSPHLLGNITWAPNEGRFVILTWDGVEMYDANSYQRLWVVPPLAAAHAASGTVFGYDGNLVVYRSLSGIEIRDIDSGKLLAGELGELNNKCPGEAFGMAFAPDGQTIYIGVDSTVKGVTSVTINKWDISSLECLGEFTHLSGFRNFMDQSSNGRYLAVGTTSNITHSDDGEIAEEGQTWVWDMESGKQVCGINYPLAAFWPETNVLVVPGDGKLDYWTREFCEVGREVELTGIPAPYALAINPEKALLVMSKDQIWAVDLLSGDLLLTIDDLSLKDILADARSLYSTLSFSPDWRFLLFAVPNPQNILETLIVLWRVER